MRRRLKEPSYLKFYIIISLVIHLAILYFIPFNPTTVATKGLLETEGQFYDVEFVQLENEPIKLETPKDQVSLEEKEIIKEETEEKPEQKPETPPVNEAKPEEVTQGILGSEDQPVETEATLEKVDAEPEPTEELEPETVSEPAENTEPVIEPEPIKNVEPEPVTEPDPVVEPEPEPIAEPEPITEPEPIDNQELISEPTQTVVSNMEEEIQSILNSPSESQVEAEEIVTNANSDEVIEIQEQSANQESESTELAQEEKPTESQPEQTIESEESQPVEKLTEKPEQQESEKIEPQETVPSTPEEKADPEPAPEPQEEKKPALPTAPEACIAQSIKPVYPKAAANEGIEGVVDLLITVAASGDVNDVEVINSSNDIRLDGVAVNTIKRGWKFKPYPYPYTITLKIEYKAGDTKVTLGDLEFLE